MKSAAVALLIAFAVGANAHGNEPIPLPEPTQGKKDIPETKPIAVDRSPVDKKCPSGFHSQGKQCIKIVTVPAEYHCPSGTVRDDDQCAKYAPKLSECAPGFGKTANGLCLRSTSTEPSISCPADFILTGKLCTKSIALPPVYFCPSGTVQKGETCVYYTTEAPTSVCAPGWTLAGNKCRTEETYDCTPVRDGKKLRMLAAQKHSDNGKHAAPTTDEFVLQKTCKRVKTEAPHKICANGTLNGKVCSIEETSELSSRSGGFAEESIKPSWTCSEGFSSSGSGPSKTCTQVEEQAATHFCPHGTEDLGNKCAIFRSLVASCPAGFGLDGETCTKVIYAAPIVEYSVTYKCLGKNCANHH